MPSESHSAIGPVESIVALAVGTVVRGIGVHEGRSNSTIVHCRVTSSRGVRIRMGLIVDRVAAVGVVLGGVFVPRWIAVVGRGIMRWCGTVGRRRCAHDGTAVYVAAHVHLLINAPLVLVAVPVTVAMAVTVAMTISVDRVAVSVTAIAPIAVARVAISVIAITPITV